MEFFIECLGWVGAVCLTLCGLPQLYTTVRYKKVEGLSLGMLVAWHVGGVLTGIYIAITAFRWPLIFNYGLNTIVTSLLIYMYLKYRNKE
jgi:uncharacterized protein with PQ loop repeat